MKPLDLDVIAVVDTQVKPLLVGCQLIHGRLSTSVFSRRARTFKPVLVLKHSQLIRTGLGVGSNRVDHLL